MGYFGRGIRRFVAPYEEGTTTGVIEGLETAILVLDFGETETILEAEGYL